jgi:quinoprotein glucose dehydrogenase
MRRILLLALAVPAFAAAQNLPGEWPYYHRDLASTRYSPLDQITRSNVATLTSAWSWKSDTAATRDSEFKNENTPLMIGGVLYITTGHRRTVIALDAATGKPIESFGANGIVDLKANLGVPNINLDSATIGNSSPPLVVGDVVVIPPALLEGSRPTSMRNTPGRVMAFDVKTGALKWRFNTIPQKGRDRWLILAVLCSAAACSAEMETSRDPQQRRRSPMPKHEITT